MRNEPIVAGVLLGHLMFAEVEHAPAKTHECTAKLPGCIGNIEDDVSTHHECWRCVETRRKFGIHYPFRLDEKSRMEAIKKIESKKKEPRRCKICGFGSYEPHHKIKHAHRSTVTWCDGTSEEV
jgi:hypothetical protein